MDWTCGATAALAVLCLYLGWPRQTLWRAALGRKYLLRWLSAPLLAGAVASAVHSPGWGGTGMLLCGLLAALVTLPWLDARLHGGAAGQQRRPRLHRARSGQPLV